MTRSFQVDSLIFDFDDNDVVSKYDEWSYYRNTFCSFGSGKKAVDLIVVRDRITFFVESKDYRFHPRTKPSDICLEIADKVTDTLASFLPIRCTGRVSSERAVSRLVMRSREIKVILHLEQPKKRSVLFPEPIKQVDVLQKLKTVMRGVDFHPIIASRSNMHNLPWKMRSAPLASKA